MEPLYQYAWLIPVLPLIGAIVLGVGLISYGQATTRLRSLSAFWVISMMAGAMIHSITLLISQLQGHPSVTTTLDWVAAGSSFHLQMGYTIDHLTALMLVIVTTVALAVMIYTDGYLSHDPGYVRFYAYLSLWFLHVRLSR